MIVIRIDFKTGLHLEYNFPEIATAQVIYDRLASGLFADKIEGQIVSFDDYAGRSAWVDCRLVAALGLIDIEVEARSVVALNVLVERAGRSALPKPLPAERVDGGALPRPDA